MKRICITALACLLTALAGVAGAADFKAGDIVVSEPWARASASKAMKAGAAFVTLSNHGGKMDRLVAAASPVAMKTELHTHLMDGGVMRMRQVDAIEVHPGTPTVLQPGGLHIMFMGLRAPLKEGQKIPVTLTFEQAGQVVISATVLAPGAKGLDGMGHHGHGS